MNPRIKGEWNHDITQGFLDLEREMRSRIDPELDSASYFRSKSNYVNSLTSFLDELGIELESWPSDDVDERISEIEGYRARLIARDLINKGEHDNTALSIPASYKTEIHDKLRQIRKIIDVTELPDGKKDRIYDRISALGLEVDREKTRLGTFLSNVLDITDAAGEAAENLDPLFKKIQGVLKSLSKAKAESNAKQIEASETKQLPAPDDGEDES